jgi:hypothetical protein
MLWTKDKLKSARAALETFWPTRIGRNEEQANRYAGKPRSVNTVVRTPKSTKRALQLGYLRHSGATLVGLPQRAGLLWVNISSLSNGHDGAAKLSPLNGQRSAPPVVAI